MLLQSIVLTVRRRLPERAHRHRHGPDAQPDRSWRARRAGVVAGAVRRCDHLRAAERAHLPHAPRRPSGGGAGRLRHDGCAPPRRSSARWSAGLWCRSGCASTRRRSSRRRSTACSPTLRVLDDLAGRAAWEARGRFDLSTLAVGHAAGHPARPHPAAGVAADPAAAAAVYVLSGLPSLIWILSSLGRRGRPT